VAQRRAYRDGQQCPRCGSNWLPKYGRSRGKQTYRCGQCLYHFILGTEHPHQPERVKVQAVSMYSEGSSIEAISRVMGVKAGTIYSWVKKSPSGLGSAEGSGS
jgi:transposase-like protein